MRTGPGEPTLNPSGLGLPPDIRRSESGELEVDFMDGRKERSAVSGAFAAALEEFEDEVRLRTLQTAPRQRLDHAITLVDSMLGALEHSNLTGTAPARGSLESAISALRRVTPVKCEIAPGAARSAGKLMDELFSIQQQLLALRAGPAWEWAYTEDERATPDRDALRAGA